MNNTADTQRTQRTQRTLNVPRIPAITAPAGIPAAFATAQFIYRDIACVNWPEAYPYRPDASFAIAHSGDQLYIHYKVREQSVRAAGTHDKAHVWEDSCVEFFCAPGDDNTYINLEANCAGALYICTGPDRDHRTFLPDHAYAAIQRWSTLTAPILPELLQSTGWQLALIVPAATYGLDTFTGKTLRGNFYKCGDLLSVPHFLSWAPIGTPTPNFHCPEYFGRIDFE
mgnify:FL=1